jgi:hypothetical protein
MVTMASLRCRQEMIVEVARQEGQQKLGILYQEENLKLWLASYDPFESILMDPSEVKEHCTRTVQVMPDISEEDQELLEDGIMWAQCKWDHGFMLCWSGIRSCAFLIRTCYLLPQLE